MSYTDIQREIYREYITNGYLTIVVYDSKYPDQIELAVTLYPGIDPYQQIKSQMVTYFGYDKREPKWSRYFDLASERSFEVMFQGDVYRLTEFLQLLDKTLPSEVKIPRDKLLYGMVRIGKMHYYIVKDPGRNTIEFLTPKRLKPSQVPEKRIGDYLGFIRYQGDIVTLWRGKRRILGRTYFGDPLPRQVVDRILEEHADEIFRQANERYKRKKRGEE